MYHLQVVTPEEIIFDGEVMSLIAPGTEGYLGVLTDHAPLLASLKEGVLIITDTLNKKSYYKVSTGFLEVINNKVSIVVKTIKPTTPVDIDINDGL